MAPSKRSNGVKKVQSILLKWKAGIFFVYLSGISTYIQPNKTRGGETSVWKLLIASFNLFHLSRIDCTTVVQ